MIQRLLNARLLGFTVDPAFGGSLDGLMLVDLRDVDPAILSKYMGKTAADAYLAFQARRPPPEPSAQNAAPAVMSVGDRNG